MLRAISAWALVMALGLLTHTDALAGQRVVLKNALHGPALWSPDGVRAAVITERGVAVHDLQADRTRTFKLDSPLSILWSGPESLAVLGAGRVAFINSEAIETSALSLNAPANHLLAAPGLGLLMASNTIGRTRIGYDSKAALIWQEADTSGHRLIYQDSRIMPHWGIDTRLCGWPMQEPDPYGYAAVYFQCIDPPALKPYARILLIETDTGAAVLLHQAERIEFMPHMSWSPRGTRFAASDTEGRLSLVGRDGGLTRIRTEARGIAPAWHPSGRAIYLGGHIIRPTGEVLERVLEDAPESIGSWQPGEGGRLAIVHKGRLIITEPVRVPDGADINEPLPAEAVSDIRMLRRLYVDSLIEQAEFRQRLSEIQNRVGAR